MKVSHVLSCLRRLDLAQYTPSFAREAIDGEVLGYLDDQLLQFQLGMADEGHRRRLLDWVDSMLP